MSDIDYPNLKLNIHAFTDYVSVIVKITDSTIAVLDASVHTLSNDTVGSIYDEEPLVIRAFWLSRINVPSKHEGHGIGSRLLDRFLSLMDKTQNKAAIAINPSGRLGYEQLLVWYGTRGFVPDPRLGGLLVRNPQPVRLKEFLDESEY